MLLLLFFSSLFLFSLLQLLLHFYLWILCATFSLCCTVKFSFLCCATLCVSFWPQKVFWPTFTFISGFGQFVVAQGQAGKGSCAPFCGLWGCEGVCASACACASPRGCGGLWCTSLPVKAVYAVACYHLWLTHICVAHFCSRCCQLVPSYITIVISSVAMKFC